MMNGSLFNHKGNEAQNGYKGHVIRLVGPHHGLFGGHLRRTQVLLKDKTRDNGLVLSRAAELNIEAVKPLYFWFRKTFWVLDLSYPPMQSWAAPPQRE